MTWSRARTPEQMAERRSAILDAAADLFTEYEYGAISLNGIAEAAGISKPSVYRYYASKEEIFLVILTEQRDSFLSEFTKRIRKLDAPAEAHQIAGAWTATALHHETLLDLLPLLITSLERNSSMDEVVKFKASGNLHMGPVIESLCTVHPTLAPDQWIRVIETAVAHMAGLWPMCNPGEQVAAAMQHPDVGQTPWDFKSRMTETFQTLVRGIQAIEERNRP